MPAKVGQVYNLRADFQSASSAELIFEVTQETTDGGYCAECLTLDIFTQGDTWDELRSNVPRGHFFDGNVPDRIRLHLGVEVFSVNR